MSDSLEFDPGCDKFLTKPTTPHESNLSQDGASLDAVLVEAGLKGEERAFEGLFNRHYDRIFAICYRFGGRNPAVAKDLCQETFIAAFNHLDDLRDRTRFEFWLNGIARNKSITHVRRQKLQDGLLEDYDKLKEVITDNRKRWSEAQIQVVQSLIDGIEDANLRETIRLFYIDGVSTQVIAEKQGISQSLVTTRLNRFRGRFRKRIIEEILKRE